MRAVVRGRAGARVEQRPVPEPGAGEARIRVELAGVCRTDVAAARGQLAVREGLVLGHELCGVVEAVGDPGDGAWIGRRVSVDPSHGAGFLGLHRDGAFAEAVVAPVGALVRLPAGLDARRGAFVEPMAAALAVLAAGIPPGARVRVGGGGRIGVLTARVLRCAGCDVVDHDDGAVDVLVHSSMGALSDLSGVRTRGLVVCKSRPPSPVAVDLRDVVERELRLVGVRYGSFEAAAEWLADGRVEVDDLLGPALGLDGFEEAFAATEEHKLFLGPGA